MSTTNPTVGRGEQPWYADLDNITELARWMHDEGRVFSFNDALHVYEHPKRYTQDWHEYQHHRAKERADNDERLLRIAEGLDCPAAALPATSVDGRLAETFGGAA